MTARRAAVEGADAGRRGDRPAVGADDGRGRPGDAEPEPDPVRPTGRWRGVGALALLIAGTGVVLGRPAVLLLAVVGVAYAAYAARGRPPAVDLRVERELSDRRATPGDAVEVTLTVVNEGPAPLWDLRLVDAVPPGLAVERASPRLGTALRPGRRATLTYAVTARRGTHEFGPVTAIVRDLAGTAERVVTPAAPATLTCLPDVEGAGDVPLRAASTRYTGRVPTDTGGEGVEFHATRAYRPGDPPSRIDWNRRARTRELATLLFREERAATVVLLVDVRREAYRAPRPAAESAVDRSVDGAAAAFGALQAAGDRVGIAGFGPRGGWLAPGAGSDHREAARRLLGTHPAFAAAPPTGRFFPRRALRSIRRRAPVDAQFVLFTPATDDYIATVARRLQAHGHPVTLVSPDVTDTATPGRQLARVERRLRLNGLREADVRVVDWAPDEPLAAALARASTGWSA